MRYVVEVTCSIEIVADTKEDAEVLAKGAPWRYWDVNSVVARPVIHKVEGGTPR